MLRLSSHFSCQAQLDAQFSPTLKDEISDIPFTQDTSHTKQRTFLSKRMHDSLGYVCASWHSREIQATF